MGFASAIVTLCFITTIVILLEIVEYMMLPNRVNVYAGYHGYFALALWILIQIYVTRNKRRLSARRL